jgi:hypothetical protein
VTVFKKEAALAAVVVSWLKDLGWDVHQEVCAGGAAKRADIVAVMGSRLWVIETKLVFGLAVLEQAAAWRYHANMVSLATRPTRAGRFITAAMKAGGLGWLAVPEDGSNRVRVEVSPRLERRTVDRLRGLLNEHTRNHAAAGNANHEFWTPFRQTCRGVADAVREKPGISIREVFEHVGHHYTRDATARSAMLKWIQTGRVPGVEARYEGRRLLLYPTKGEPDATS